VHDRGESSETTVSPKSRLTLEERNLPKKLECDDGSTVFVCLLEICLLLIFLHVVLVKSSGEKYGERYIGLLGWLWSWLWVLRGDRGGRL
jgi:hypothetical protein